MLDYQLVVKFAEFRSCEGLLAFGEIWRVLDELVECHRRFGDVSRDVLRHVAPGIVALCVNLCELFCQGKILLLSLRDILHHQPSQGEAEDGGGVAQRAIDALALHH